MSRLSRVALIWLVIVVVTLLCVIGFRTLRARKSAALVASTLHPNGLATPIPSSGRAAPSGRTTSAVAPPAPDLVGVEDANGRFGFIDPRGNLLIEPQFEEVMSTTQGLTAVRSHGLWGFLDRNANWAIAAQFASVQPFSEDRAAAAPRAVGKLTFGFIDRTGNWRVKPQFEDVLSFQEGLARVHKNGVERYIDLTGHVAFETPGQGSYGFHDGLARVSLRDRFGFMDNQGRLVIAADFTSALEFSEGLAAVQVGSLWGFVDKTGAYRIPLKFVDAGFFNQGIAKVWLTRSTGSYVDTRGKLLGSYEAVADCVSGMAAVMKSGLWGFIDSQGALVIPPRFEKFEFGFHDGLAAVAEPRGQFGYVGTDGRYVIEPRFVNVGQFEHGVARVEQVTSTSRGLEFGYIDRQGTFLWGPFPVRH